MSKVVHYGVDEKSICRKEALDITEDITTVNCKKCLKRIENNPEDPFNKNSKRCLHCDEVKSLDSFSIRNDSFGGIKSWCNECIKETRRPKKIHLMIGNESLCGDIDAAKFSEDIKEVDCKRCNRIYFNETEFSVKGGKKKCRNCEEIKDVDKFLNNSQCKDGKSNWCRECSNGPYKKEIYPDGFKRCSKCNELKELDEFSNSQIGPLGKSSSCKECQKQFREENKDRVLEKQREYYWNNKEVINARNNINYGNNKEKISEQSRKRRRENPEKEREKHLKWSRAIAKYSTYAHRLTIEELPICVEDDELWCRCTYCGEYHPITNLQAKSRVLSLEGKNNYSEGRFYCQDSCKQLCPIFYRSKYPKGFKTNNEFRCNQQRVRQILLDLQMDEYGYTYCEKCGEPFSPDELYFHHNVPIGDDPNEYDNAAHYMIVCQSHHEHNGCLGNKY